MTDILRTIGSIARELDSIANVEFKEQHLTKGQYLYLVRICEHPGIIQGDLAEMLRVDRTTAARAVKKLEKDGLIERGSDAINQKIKRLYPTSAGKELYPMLKRENDYSNATALKSFSKAEAEMLSSLLERVEQQVYADWREVKKGHSRKY